MKPPKLLPWIARRAGIHEDLALKLWRRAAGEAEERIGNASSSEYYATALERFFCLVEDETCKTVDGHSRISWFWRHQQQMVSHSLATSAATCRWWKDLYGKLASNGSAFRHSSY